MLDGHLLRVMEDRIVTISLTCGYIPLAVLTTLLKKHHLLSKWKCSLKREVFAAFVTMSPNSFLFPTAASTASGA